MTSTNQKINNLESIVSATTSSLTELEDEVADRIAVIRSDITQNTADIAQNTADIATLQSGGGQGGGGGGQGGGHPSTVVFLHRYRSNDYNMTGGSQFIAFNSANQTKRGSHLEVSGADGIKVLIAGWYRVSWSIAFRTMSIVANLPRKQVRTFVAVNDSFSSSAGSFGSAIYLRSETTCPRGHSAGHNLMYVQADEIIKIGANCCIETAVDWNSSFTGTRLESSSTFQVELVSEDSEN